MAEFRYLSVIMLNVTYKPFVLSAIMLAECRYAECHGAKQELPCLNYQADRLNACTVCLNNRVEAVDKCPELCLHKAEFYLTLASEMTLTFAL